MTNEMGARLGCHAELLKDRTSTIKAQITAINKIAKLAKVPNIPPMHAPVDKMFWFDEYTAKHATNNWTVANPITKIQALLASNFKQLSNLYNETFYKTKI